MIKKLYLIFFLVLFTTTPIFSVEFDWGASIQNTTDASSVGGWSLTQADSISLWTELDFHPFFNIKAAGGYRFSYDSGTISHIPEFSALTFYGGNKSISYQAGRFNLSDQNNNLFGSIIDGLEFNLQSQKIKISSGAGFSGLVFNKNSTVSMTSKDLDSSSGGALLASPRIVEYAEASFFILPGDGALTAALLAQQDMRSSSSIVSGEGLLHSFYLNAGLKGRLGNSVFYNLYGTGEVGMYNMVADNRTVLLVAGAGGLKINIPLNSIIKPLISVDLYYSTGDNWDRTDHQGSTIDPAKTMLNQYTPFTLQNKGYVYNVGVGNLFYGDVNFSISPFSFLSVTAGSLTLFRSVNGPVSTLPVDEATSSASLLLGEEITLVLNFRPMSDLGFQIKGGIFIPNSAVVSDGIQYKVSGFLSLSF